jgi:phosphoglycolate phosphatase
MIRCVVFDFDGTLVDSNNIKQQGFYSIASAHPNGASHMAEALTRIEYDREGVLRDYARRMFESGVPLNPDLLAKTYSAQVDESVATAPEISGATQLLRYLKGAGLKIHVSSRTPQENLQRILTRRGWLPLFDGVYGSPATKLGTLRNIVRREKVMPSEVVVVGDGDDDAAAAANAGCLFIGVYRGSSTLTGQDLNALSLTEVKHHFERLLAGRG